MVPETTVVVEVRVFVLVVTEVIDTVLGAARLVEVIVV